MGTPRLKILIEDYERAVLKNSVNIDNIVRVVIEENAKAVDDYKHGKDTVIGYLIGKVLKSVNGELYPRDVEECLRRQLSSSNN
jgi:Asp-tRNA(Asn)/Glu-tRNA(Gln) amidotransferase B subunit